MRRSNDLEIPEIVGAGSPSASKIVRRNDYMSSCYYDYVSFENGPILRFQYKDPDSGEEKLTLIVPLPAGAQEPRSELNGSGSVCHISYTWPKICYQPSELFRLITKNPLIPGFHPKVVGLESELANFRQKLDEEPRARVNIQLPIVVQTDKSKIKRQGLKGPNGQNLVVIELTAMPSDYNETLDETLISFD